MAARRGARAGEAARGQGMVVYARRNGDDQQASAMLRHRAHLDDAVHRVQDIIDARFTEPLPLGELTTAVGVSERPPTRSLTKATGLTPLRYQQVLRLERADHLLGRGATAEPAARAVGFADARMLRRIRSREGRARAIDPLTLDIHKPIICMTVALVMVVRRRTRT